MRKNYYVLKNAENHAVPGSRPQYLSLIRVNQLNTYFKKQGTGYRWEVLQPQIHDVYMRTA